MIKNDKLKKLLTINKKKCQFVAVLVKPDNNDLEKIKDLKVTFVLQLLIAALFYIT